jgi:hypothetical protein
MIVDSTVEPKAKAGTTVYRCTKPDYGLVSGDERGLGVPCIFMTLDKTGDYPGFVVRQSDVEKVTVVEITLK